MSSVITVIDSIEDPQTLKNACEKIYPLINKDISNDFTIITIAHRLSTIINSDKIYVIDNGSIVASGTHKQLLKTNEYYKELYNK